MLNKALDNWARKNFSFFLAMPKKARLVDGSDLRQLTFLHLILHLLDDYSFHFDSSGRSDASFYICFSSIGADESGIS